MANVVEFEGPGGARELPALSRLVHEALRAHLADACQLLVSVEGRLLHRQAAGLAAPPPARQACGNDTLFDLGRLTMPLAGGMAALWLAGQRRLSLGGKLGQLLPALARSPYADATVDMLLDHTSGMPAEAPLHAQVAADQRHLHPRARTIGRREAAGALATALAAVPPVAPPGSRRLPSSLGFQALGWVVEKVAGEPLDRLLAARIWRPLGVGGQVMFLPVAAGGSGTPATSAGTPEAVQARRRAVQGPPCPQRRVALRGEVRDLNAWAQGGVAGHAGLFASATAVWALMQSLLAASRGRPTPWHPASVARFWAPSQRAVGGDPGPGRALGWDLAGSAGAAGRLARHAVGHDGPAMGVWCDVPRQVVVALLGARHDGVVAEQGIQSLHARIYQAAGQAAASGAPPMEAAEALGLVRDLDL